VVWVPELAPGLTNEPMENMAGDSMMDGESMGDSMK